MSEENDSKPRTQETVLAHREYLVKVLAMGARNADALIRMQLVFPDYTQNNLNYDRSQLRRAWKSKVIESHAEEQAKELETLQVMLSIARDEFLLAKTNALREVSTTSQRYQSVENAETGMRDMLETERTETLKEVLDNDMVKFWWKEMRSIQNKIIDLKGLNHINVNIQKNETLHVKGYVSFAPHEVWPNLPQPDDANIIEGEIADDE